MDDGVDVAERGDCEIEGKWQRRTVRGDAPERETAFRFGCGVGMGTEVAVALAKTRSADARHSTCGAEGKTSLRERADGQLGWTLAFGASAE